MKYEISQEQKRKVKIYQQLNAAAQKGGILFTGSSLMEQFPVCELCMSAGIRKVIYNRGIGGFTTEDFLDNIKTQLLDLEPSKVFINIGTNDMNPRFGPDWMEQLLGRYHQILEQLKAHCPDAEVYLMAFYPVNANVSGRPAEMDDMFKIRTKENLELVNGRMKDLAAEFAYHFIDVNDGLTDENGALLEAYAIDGIHMYPDGYKQVFRNLQPYI